MSSVGKNFRVNGDRLWESIMEMAKIGPGVAGGNNRQTLTDDDAKGRELFKSWCEKEGLAMGLDTMGNMFARREGTDPNALPVMVGSHLDTQPTGGKYDGVLGVLGGLEIIRTLNDLDIKTKHPIEIVNWTNEEGTRFAPPMLSSGVFASMHTEEWAYNREDSEGKKFGDELKRIGWRGEEPVGERKLHAFYELHIEQGPILEDENVDIGVVTHGQGLNWLQVTLVGKESHTGSTPMPKRVNAGLGMARITQLVDEIALSHAPHAVGAIGHIDVYPNSRNIIPGKVVFTVDFRHPNKEVIQDMEDRMRKGAADIAEKIGVHESTISRITSNKYILTPLGIMNLKEFFSNKINNDDQKSTTAIREIINTIIIQEDKKHPLSDQEIKEILAVKGINIARRTIAKYRNVLKIPSSSMRRLKK